MVLEGDCEVEPGHQIADHGEEDQVGGEGRHGSQSPEIDSCEVDEGNEPDPKEHLVVIWGLF